ncbi:protein-tyrosine-phosphatase [Tenacibaculum sp. UWU-22]|uniref:protein-tyrosine-phosphatase n=1 Tax=Tenacibaculum sp. UWU-22 TaxID=3234187 RepID=UPI0034DB1079
MPLYTNIQHFISLIDITSISEERKQILQPLIDYIQEKVNLKKEIRLNFICTHNSRRSHLAQVWAQTMAYYFKIENVFCYSGGTQETALFFMVAETLKNTGFKVKTLSKENNPIYSIKYAENEYPIIGFSKKLDDDFNPKSEFCAIMTCDQADEGCPFIAGTKKRVSITFKDPKVFDNTPQQTQKYEERSFQIATEMFYIFSKIEL